MKSPGPIDRTIDEIRGMQTHSESVVAVKATRALSELTEREYASVEEFERALEHNAGALRRANLSHALLHDAMDRMIEAVLDETATVEAAQALTARTIERVVHSIEHGKEVTASNLADTFADGETFLTHENSSTVMAAVEAAAASKSLTAYVTESRPRFIGRITARKLAAVDGVDPHLIVDGAAGHFLRESDRVVIGMNCIVDDTLYNRIGTFPLIAAANVLDVPVVVAGVGAKVVDEGFVFENETRSSTEVMKEPAEGFAVENPAYDATPLSLVDTVITDEGSWSPE